MRDPNVSTVTIRRRKGTMRNPNVSTVTIGRREGTMRDPNISTVTIGRRKGTMRNPNWMRGETDTGGRIRRGADDERQNNYRANCSTYCVEVPKLYHFKPFPSHHAMAH
jgi:hypothetical protein